MRNDSNRKILIEVLYTLQFIQIVAINNQISKTRVGIFKVTGHCPNKNSNSTLFPQKKTCPCETIPSSNINRNFLQYPVYPQ